jgi:DNA primase
MRIPEHIVEQILRQTDIVEVISDVVQLRQRGRNFLGLCPFHNEKTPSFNVLPERGIFKCFGCGKGGNAATFLRDFHNMSYPEALRELAKRAGIVLPDERDAHLQEESNRYQRAYEALRAAAHFYYRMLFSESGAVAMAYLRRRGFTNETIKTFGLGFSPESYSATGAELKSLGHSEEALLDAGLSGRNDSGKLYDRFRGRLMFPIHNTTGRIIGFGARRMNDTDTTGPNAAKYVNSPQSLVYDKSKVLYGIFQAKDEIRRKKYAILVEGYADVLSVYQAGLKNVVASSGTSLPREQLRMLAGYCKRLKIVYDADAAGVNAALRGLDVAIEEGFDVEIVRLPQGDDPDSFIQKHGAEPFQRRLDEAQTLVAFKCEVLQSQGVMKSPSGQAEAVRSVLDTIARCPDQLKRDFMIRDVALRFALAEHDLYRELNIVLRKRQFDNIQSSDRQTERQDRLSQGTASRAASQVGQMLGTAADAHAGNRGQTNEQVPVSSGGGEHSWSVSEMLPAERELLRVVLTQRGAIRYVKSRLQITEESFLSDTAQMLFALMEECEANPQHEPLRILMSRTDLGDAVLNALAELALRPEMPSDGWKKYNVELSDNVAALLRDCSLQLKIYHYEAEIERLNRVLKQAVDRGDGEEGQLSILIQLQDADYERRRLQAMMADEPAFAQNS